MRFERLWFAVKVLVWLLLFTYVVLHAFVLRRQTAESVFVVLLFPDQVFLLILAFAVTFFNGKIQRLFIIDWLPFMLFVILYYFMRSLIIHAHGFVHIAEPYAWEKTLFGWALGGRTPAEIFQEWKRLHAEDTLKYAADAAAALFYVLHFVVPFLFAFALWRRGRDRRMFYRFASALTLVNLLALITFVVYPTAPPWYRDFYGVLQPTHSHYAQAGAGLMAVDAVLKIRLFTTLWDAFNPNYFAAVPSLHGTWPLIVAVFARVRFGPRANAVFLYPLAVCLAGAYLNHHYFVDYFVGWLYFWLAWRVTHAWLMPWLDTKTPYRLNSR